MEDKICELEFRHARTTKGCKQGECERCSWWKLEKDCKPRTPRHVTTNKYSRNEGL